MVVTDMCGKKPFTGEWICGITQKHALLTILFIFNTFGFFYYYYHIAIFISLHVIITIIFITYHHFYHYNLLLSFISFITLLTVQFII